MPAHTRPILRLSCQHQSCDRLAEVAVYNGSDELIARMCKPHGEGLARKLAGDEASRARDAQVRGDG